MAEAEVGDEQQRGDPTVTALCREVAERLGHEAAVFLPTGTMCNLIGVATHVAPGDAVIMEHLGHVLRSETGGIGVVSGAVVDTVRGERGVFTAADLAPALEPGNAYRPPPTLVCLEQTHNFGGGTVWPLDGYTEVVDLAHGHGLRVHLDGARLFNAVVASGVAADRWAGQVDSAWIDFTKGLGAPLGAVLAGPTDYIERAWRWKHRLGGAMRQAGIAAAACRYALANNVERLADDHVPGRGPGGRVRRARPRRRAGRVEHGVGGAGVGRARPPRRSPRACARPACGSRRSATASAPSPTSTSTTPASPGRSAPPRRSSG